MNSAEMFQLFQVLLDKLDTQFLPDIPVEQFFLLINTATDEYVQAVRQAFEKNRKISEDASTLVKRVFITPTVDSEGRFVFSFDRATLSENPTTPNYQDIYYLINGKAKGYWGDQSNNKSGITQLVFTQQDDITVEDPFNQPKFADKIPAVIEDHSLIATTPSQLTLTGLVGTAILKPALISQTTPSNLPQQLHTTLVKRAVSLALEVVESERERTFDQN